jgi:hypothetical protein
MSPLEDASDDGANDVSHLHDDPPWVFRALDHAEGFEVSDLFFEFDDSLHRVVAANKFTDFGIPRSQGLNSGRGVIT